jgi:uncharacterized protein (DUF885 family)
VNNATRLGWLAWAALTLATPAWAQQSADARFKQIYEAEWSWRNGQAGINTSGEAQPNNGRLDTVDAANQQRRLDYWQKVLANLSAVDARQLSAEDQVNYAVYRAQIQNLLAVQQYKQWQMPFNSDSAFWSDLGYVLNADDMRMPQDYRRYLDRLGQVPAYFDQQIDNMRDGLARGFTVPRAVLDGRDVSIAAVAELKDPTQSSFYKPFQHIPVSVPAAQGTAMQDEARKVIAEKVIPSYGKLLTFFRNEYLPKARTTLAAEAMPDGKAWYRQQIVEYTTLDLDPDAIHQVGLEQVAKIHAEMVKTMRESGFKGSFAEFLHFLRTDQQFHAKTPDELLMRSAWVAKQVDGQLGKFFDHLPRQRFAIVPVAPDIAPYYTSGRGGASAYLVNTYDLPSRPLYNVAALTLHESAPGHSLQLALAAEQKGQPAFRREGYISAYGEGWGLYSEYLGNEMGIYKTPYERFGYLTWTRQQAIDYLTDNTALSAREIANEVDRYISWPGQALSYELGYLKILELRRKAEQALGPKFGIRHFHDTLLQIGSVPLPVLEQRIDRFIAEGGPEPDFGCDCAKPAATKTP